MKNSYIYQNTHKSHKGNTAQVLCGVAFTFLHGIPFQTTGSESFKNIVFITRNVVKFIHDFLAFSNPYKFSEIRRITPAYAGKRKIILIRCQILRDHPRLCGEKLQGGDLRVLRVGITPAYAGKSPNAAWIDFLSVGSPPPMRGKAELHEDRENWHGITPAYAGKRRNQHDRFHRQQDHPRLCGEKAVAAAWTALNPGSPPPMRGKGILKLQNFISLGITPAYAGKSRRPRKRYCSRWDHPRLCGKRHKLDITIYLYKDHPRLCGEKGAA